MDNEVVDVRICRPPQELGPTQVYFRPALIYQVRRLGVALIQPSTLEPSGVLLFVLNVCAVSMFLGIAS